MKREIDEKVDGGGGDDGGRVALSRVAVPITGFQERKYKKKRKEKKEKGRKRKKEKIYRNIFVEVGRCNASPPITASVSKNVS